MSETHRGQVRPRSQRGDGFGPDKPVVERPPLLTAPGVCWCGDRHPGGLHPWPPLDGEQP
ncbi:MAG TPA: hypothetical protein VFV01_47855 [Spirillospora sp.]|nr:hypothetical protein [Spirillospora sp.]